MIATTIEIVGTLHANGKLILDETPDLPPGRVRVALQALGGAARATDRLPDAPLLDESSPPPFDLPHDGVVMRVQPRVIGERLPDLLAGLTE